MRNLTTIQPPKRSVITLASAKIHYPVKDDLYRLTSETRTGTDPYTIGYTYDNVGNRKTKEHNNVMTNYTYNTRDQLESESTLNNTVTYTYDRDGRMVTKNDGSGTTNYSWIDEDRMASVVTSAGTINYTYDADNARVKVDDGVTVKNYLIDTRQQYAQVVAEYEDPAVPTVEYVFGLERIAQDRGGSVKTYLSDGQASVRQLTSTAGTVTDNYSYFAFGEELSSSGGTENEFRYVGEQFDPNAGFYYNRARWYSPSIGRFTSDDPYGGDPQSPVSLHRYLYANASPATNVDPTGLMSIGWALLSVFESNIRNAWAKIRWIFRPRPSPSVEYKPFVQVIVYMSQYEGLLYKGSQLQKDYNSRMDQLRLLRPGDYIPFYEISKPEELRDKVPKARYTAIVTHSSAAPIRDPNILPYISAYLPKSRVDLKEINDNLIITQGFISACYVANYIDVIPGENSEFPKLTTNPDFIDRVDLLVLFDSIYQFVLAAGVK